MVTTPPTLTFDTMTTKKSFSVILNSERGLSSARIFPENIIFCNDGACPCDFSIFCLTSAI